MVNFKYVARTATVFPILLVFLSVDADSAACQAVVSTWVLQKGRDIPSRPSRKPQLRMEGQKLSGSTGCNSFTATLSEKIDKHIAIEQLSLTRILCAPEQNRIEAAFVRALKQTEYLEQKNKMLTFLSVTREPLLVWGGNHRSTAKRPISRKHYAGFRRYERAVARRGCGSW